MFGFTPASIVTAYFELSSFRMPVLKFSTDLYINNLFLFLRAAFIIIKLAIH